MTRIAGIFAAVSLSLAAIAPAAIAPAAAQPAVGTGPATLLGAFNNWQAYSTGSGSSLTCYALSKPRATRPKGAKRTDIYLMVSAWPSRKIKGEVQIVLGYPGNEKGAASLGVGPEKFAFFIRNTGKESSAWLTSLNDNQRLIDSMRGGVSAVASGVSQRGTKTIDTYSLSGFNDALTKIQTTCQM
jgi:hypothetical protein